MKALVVYESIFGNTAMIGEAIADGLRRAGADATTIGVDLAPVPVPDDVELLVVGGPTHAFGLSRSSTRADATRREGFVGCGPKQGLREWLGSQPAEPRKCLAATFDTRVRHPRVPGSAARRAAARLRRLGFHVTTKPVTFWVEGVEGPLLDGEPERAFDWAARLAERAAPRVSSH